MKKTLLSILLACIGTLAFSQLNMTLLDEIDYGVNANDVWGYVDPDDGTEYALVGLVNGLSIVDLTDPENVVEVQLVPGPNSTWRDIKSWGEHVYVTNETGNGLLVVDMSGAPDNITWFEWTPNIPGLGTLSSCHNIYIDEFGYAYLAGCNLNSGGMLIIDVFSDPGNPQFEVAAPSVYSHDVYTRENLMYASEIYAGHLAIYDVTDKQNIELLATQTTPYEFTHNAWLNDAGDVVFTTDETGNAPVAAYDISDLDNIVELDQFIPIATMGEDVIPHNVHVWEDWLIISYYTDGGIIADASKPDNIIEVGNWDTFLGGNGGFSGVWGAYPFLPSGLVLLTDINTGLYVCGADYVRACWLEGMVTDAVTGNPILGATVDIDSPQPNFATSDFNGEYQTGQAIPGDFEVTFAANGYIPKTVNATLANGELTILNVELEPLSSYEIAGQVVKSADGTPIAGAQVFFRSNDNEYTTVSDAGGNFTFASVLGGNYQVYAGAWGYLNEDVGNVSISDQTMPFVISLDQGYHDDFIVDLGWSSTGTASTGTWVRAEPDGTTFGNGASNPDFDVDGDIGDQCYVTGNGGGGAGNDDVDNGIVTLTSPPMDMSNMNEPVLTYSTWFFNDGGNGSPNDALQVRLTNGTDEVTLETITTSNQSWNPPSEFNLAGMIDLTDNMQVIFETSDLAGSGHLVEAAVDAFQVTETSVYPPFTNTDTEGCSPFTVAYTDNSDSTTVWAWSFEGGNPATSDLQNPVVVYEEAGTYSVSLTVTTNSGNTYTINRPNHVTVNAAPAAGFSANTSGNTVNFTNTSTGGGTFEWDFGDNQTSTAENPSHIYDETGLFTATLTVTNDCGSNTFTSSVEVLAVPPVAVFSVSAASGCAPFEIQFTDQSTGIPNSWDWTFPGGTPSSSTEQNPVITYNEAGTYSVMLTASNPAGTSEVTQSQFIEIGANPTVGFSFAVDGNNVTFTNSSSNASSYEWEFGDANSTTSTDENPTFTYDGPGQYEVTLTATNDCGLAVSTQTVIIELSSTIELDESAFQLSASPNPFAEQLLVNYELFTGFEQAELRVFNVLGEQISTVQLDAAIGTVSFENEITQSGVYFLQLSLDGKLGQALRVVKL